MSIDTFASEAVVHDQLLAQRPRLHYYEVEPEDSRFYTIGVDVTHRCNMNCANCYSPLRTIADVDRDQLFDFFRRLGRKTELRLTGGEPTLRQDLPEIIAKIKEYRHRPAIMTNGLRLADAAYARELKRAGLRFVCLSMNGADDDEVYLRLDNRKCAELKMAALENCIDTGFFININCILTRDINPHVPRRLFEILQRRQINGVIRFRNIGQLGRHMDIENLSFSEMVELVCRAFDRDSNEVRRFNRVNGYEEAHNILFPLDADHKYDTTWIKVTDWRPYADSIPDPNSIRRGRMTKTFKVAPFFEHAQVNGY